MIDILVCIVIISFSLFVHSSLYFGRENTWAFESVCFVCLFYFLGCVRYKFCADVNAPKLSVSRG